MSFTARATVSAAMALEPGDQDFGWRNRWKGIERGLEQLLRPRPGPCSGEGIAAAAQDLMWFYGIAYHLTDLLKIETPIPDQAIEDAITNTPELALLRDLAILTKHGEVRRPWSGVVPVILKREGASSAGGWQLVLTIHHGAQMLNGLDVARDAVDAWRMLLKDWSLS